MEINIKEKKIDNISGIYHFAGIGKPWNGIYNEYDKLYWKYLILSPWGEKENIIKYISLMDLEKYPLEFMMEKQMVYSKKKFVLEFLKKLRRLI